jgi:hypothetical protein
MDRPCGDGALDLELELIDLVGQYDRRQFVDLAGKYDAFAKAVDCNGDFYPIRLNVANLLSEILCKYCDG